MLPRWGPSSVLKVHSALGSAHCACMLRTLSDQRDIPADMAIRYWSRVTPEDEWEQTSKFDFTFLPTQPIYSDGSCATPTVPHWALAGSAVVQLDPSGGAVRAITGSVPQGFPQTAGTGEHLAIMLIHEHWSHPHAHHTYSDCAGVVQSAQKVQWSLSPKRPFGGLWLEYHTKPLVVHKTKAHRTATQAKEEGDVVHYLGNKAADAWANHAVALEAPTAEKTKQQLAALADIRSMYLGVGVLLACWPNYADNIKSGVWTATSPDERRSAQTRARLARAATRHANQAVATHVWQWSLALRRHVCAHCRKVSKRPKTGACIAAARHLGDHITRAHHSHQLRRLGERGADHVLYCRRCGRFAHVHLSKLQEPCPTHVGVVCPSRLARMERGWHPVTRAWVGHNTAVTGSVSTDLSGVAHP